MSAEAIDDGQRVNGFDAAARTGSSDKWRAVVTLHGALDLSNAAEVAGMLNRHIDEGRRVIRVDVSQVSFMDSTALGAIVDANERCRCAHGLLMLTGVPPRIRRLIMLSGLEQTLLVDAAAPAVG